MNIQKLHCYGTMEITSIIKGIEMPVRNRISAKKLFVGSGDIYMELETVIWN